MFRSLASCACCCCILTTIVVVAVTATTADTVISSLIHSFIHSSSIAETHAHIRTNTYPCTLSISFLHSLALFPFLHRVAEKLIYFIFTFFPCRRLTNIFHFGIFMCVCVGKNLTRIHQHTYTHEFENWTVFIQAISAPPFESYHTHAHTQSHRIFILSLSLFFRA